MKLKGKLIKWLFDKEFQRLEDKIKNLSERYSNAEANLKLANSHATEAKLKYIEAQKLVESCQQTMNAICDVGVDVSMRPDRNDHSWAVVCVHGKMDYVKFMHLSSGDARSVIEFLRQFKYSNHITDSPFGLKVLIKDLIYEPKI